MNDNNKKHDEEEKLKEELKKLLEKELKKDSKYAFFQYGLHPNFLIHVLLTIILNIVMFSAIQGLTDFGIINDYGFYMIGLLAFSIAEIFAKILITKLLKEFNFYSVGLIDFGIILLLFFTVMVLPKIMLFERIWHLVIYLVSFIILRLVVSFYIKSYFYKIRKR